MSETPEARVPETPAAEPAPQAPEPSPEQTVGQALAQARQGLGLSLEDVAQQLKFAARQIEALERGQLEGLHGATFARGMVRSYARLLKLDPEPLLERIAGRVAAPGALASPIAMRRPIPFSDTTQRTNAAYVVLSLAVLAIGAAVAFEWHQERSAQRARLNFVAAAQAPLEPPRALASAAAPVAIGSGPAAPAPSAAAAPKAAAAPGSSAAPKAKPAATTEGQPDAAPGAKPAVAAEAAPAAGAAGSPPAADSRLRRIAFSFAQESWVEVKDASGKRLLAQLNAPGTRKVVEGEAPFSLVIGNAQYVTVTYDGKPVDLAPYTKVEVARLTLD